MDTPICEVIEPKKRQPNQHRKTLGQLYTRAKSHDHEIVRAQKKVSKGRPNTPPKSCHVVTGPQV